MITLQLPREVPPAVRAVYAHFQWLCSQPGDHQKSDMTITTDAYVNGTAYGYSLMASDHSSNRVARQVTFAVKGIRRDIVVYAGNVLNFNDSGAPHEATVEKASRFNELQIIEAAQFIFDYFTKG